MTKFSVIIPLYNKQAYIRRAIESAIGQDYPPQEVVIIDDCSDDGSAQIARSYEGHPLIQLLVRTEPGLGGYAARNLGVREAQGTWIAFLDADDEWKPDHLSQAYENIAANSEKVLSLFAGFEKKSATDGHVTEDRFTIDNIGKAQLFSFEQFLDIWIRHRRCPCHTSASIIRREILLKAGLFPENRCTRGGDKDLWLRVSRFGQIAFTGCTTAIFYRNVARQVTSDPPRAFRHCVLDTVEDLRSSSHSELANKLAVVANIETYLLATLIYTSRRNHLSIADHFRPNEMWNFYITKTPLFLLRCLFFRILSFCRYCWRKVEMIRSSNALMHIVEKLK